MRTGRLRTSWDGHLLLAYSHAGERATGLAAWAQDGLDQHEQLICTELGAQIGVVGVLERGGVPAAAAVREGALEVLPPGEQAVLTPAGLRGRLARALDAGYAGLRVCRELDSDVPRPSDVCRGVSDGLDEVGACGRIGWLCRQDRGRGRERLERLVDAHPDGLRTTMLTTRPVGDGLALAGEVDISNVELFEAAVARATHNDRQVLWLDVADLRFMDVAGCRALARTTRALRNAGGSLLIVDPLPPVAHVLRLLGVDRLRGLELLDR